MAAPRQGSTLKSWPTFLGYIRDAIERAYAEKYPTPGAARYVRGFRTLRRRDTTLEFLPR
jgi:hypothetical protein